ncbi:MAG: hypothetical protein FWE36_04615 [Erysipelotrichales bacterium]|nr:hypothetical protein [Erysipelotrichales bacterium]
MSKMIKYTIAFLTLTIIFWALISFFGEYNTVIDYFRNDWLWWDVLFSGLVAILVIFMVLLIKAMFSYKEINKN